MKKFVRTLAAAGAVTPFALSAVFAQSNQVECGSSFLPAGLCNAFAGASGFTLSGILSLVFGLIIALLVLYILFQIVKAVFEWIGKSNDDKARAAAIKSITNAVVAGIVLIIALLVVVFGSKALGIGDVPAVAYSCYEQATLRPTDGTVDTSKPNKKYANVTAYEGKGEGTTSGGKFTGTYNRTPDLSDESARVNQQEKVYCKDDKTGQELKKPYLVAKNVSVQRSDTGQ